MRLSNPLAVLTKLFNKTVLLGYNGTKRQFRLESISKSNDSNIVLYGMKLTDNSVSPRNYRLDRVESIKLL